MNDAARAALSRWEELADRLSQPDAAADPSRYAAWMKEYKELEAPAEAASALQNAENAREEAEELLAQPHIDTELRAMAAEQLAESRIKILRLEEELAALLISRDPDEGKSAVVEIRAGAGGEEAALFAAALYRMYTMYAGRRGWTAEPISQSRTELGGLKEASLLLEGDAPFSRMRVESGVHRVQRVPDTETQGRIHTSTATVAVLPEAEEFEISIDPGELRIDTFRSSGAGGQHINKTESAIRITHLPTGTVVECQDERSQHKNKEKAMRVLRSRLLDAKRAEQSEQLTARRRSLVGTGDRSERIRTYNFPQGRVTDHRIGLTLYRIDAVMDGDLDELIDALASAARTAGLQNSTEGTR